MNPRQDEALKSLFQQSSTVICGENLHLMNGDFVEALEPVRLGDTILDHNRVEVFKIRHTNKLIYVRFSKPFESEGIKI